jgi:DNA-binding transcriptional LysR family regulator
MELRHLRYFIVVAEEENVTRAAARLRVSQPPLSRQIRDLEAELGVELFERTGKSLHLNAAGKLFLVEARAVLERADQAMQALKSFSQHRSQQLHIGYAPSLSVAILPKILRHFESAQPLVRVHLHDRSSGEMCQGLRDGTLQAALMAMPAQLPPGDMEFFPLQTHPVCVALPPHHPLARKRAISFAELVRHPLIGYTQDDYAEYHDWLKELAKTFQTKLVLHEEYDSMTSLITAIEMGRGLALVSQSIRSFSGPRLVFRPLTPAPQPFCLGIAWRASTLDPSTRALIAAAKEMAPSLDP